MAGEFPTRWGEIRREESLNDDPRVATYRRLVEAQAQIGDARSRRGVSDALLDDALEASEPTPEEVAHGDELYLGSLARYVAALDGHIEVTAVFPNETIVVRREPPDPAQPG